MWTFRIGDLLPSTDPLSRFVTVLAAALNDLLFVNGLLMGPDRSTSEGERQYLFRTAIAHLWELSLTLAEWAREPDVQPFIDALSDDGHQDFDAIVQVARAGSDPFLRTIAHLRNAATWHYAPPKKPRSIEKALKAAADHEGRLRFGAKVGTIRADFADEIVLQFAVQQFPGDDEAQLAALRQFHSRVAELMSAAIRAVQEVLVLFFDAHKDAITFT